MDVWVATSCNERHGRCSHSHDDNCGQSELPQGSYTEAFTSCHSDSRSDTLRDKQLLISQCHVPVVVIALQGCQWCQAVQAGTMPDTGE
jgi:hypothetical protein